MNDSITFKLPQNLDKTITSGLYGIIVENSKAIISDNYSIGSKAEIAGFKNSNIKASNNQLGNDIPIISNIRL